MTDDTLLVLLAGREIGSVRRDARNHLSFAYHEDWRSFDGAFPLSLSMPLARSAHGHEPIEAFIWGLLPDNEAILQRWAETFQVSSRNAFSLISHVGEDCAGAVQFLRPDRMPLITGPATPKIEWLDDSDVAGRLRALRSDLSAWRRPSDPGQFSLAGAQPKIALLLEDGRWGVPSGRTPTTHILKPPIGGLDGHAENEHFCLSLARALDFPTATSRVVRFDDEIAIAVERYDRAFTAQLAAEAAAAAAIEAAVVGDPRAAARSAGEAARAVGLAQLAKTQPILRLHQEDFCQALAVRPTRKYQNEGGPSVARIVDVLRKHSSRPEEDIWTFVDALVLTWLIAGTDAHAKNYSVLHGGGGQVRLAPLYDLASTLPYDQFDQEKVKLAMKIGGEYRLRSIGAKEWNLLGTELRIDHSELRTRIEGMTRRLLDQVPEVAKHAKQEGLKHPIVKRLAEEIRLRAKRCRATLRRRPGAPGSP